MCSATRALPVMKASDGGGGTGSLMTGGAVSVTAKNNMTTMTTTDKNNGQCPPAAETGVARINFREDFDFLVRILDAEGRDIGVPDFDFRLLVYTTSPANAYVASRQNGVYRNCHVDEDGVLHVVCDSHGLTRGRVNLELFAQIPDDIFPDGHRLVVVPEGAPIELVRGKSDYPASMQVQVRMPVMKKGMSTDETAEMVQGALDTIVPMSGEEAQAIVFSVGGDPVGKHDPVAVGTVTPAYHGGRLLGESALTGATAAMLERMRMVAGEVSGSVVARLHVRPPSDPGEWPAYFEELMTQANGDAVIISLDGSVAVTDSNTGEVTEIRIGPAGPYFAAWNESGGLRFIAYETVPSVSGNVMRPWRMNLDFNGLYGLPMESFNEWTLDLAPEASAPDSGMSRFSPSGTLIDNIADVKVGDVADVTVVGSGGRISLGRVVLGHVRTETLRGGGSVHNISFPLMPSAADSPNIFTVECLEFPDSETTIARDVSASAWTMPDIRALQSQLPTRWMAQVEITKDASPEYGGTLGSPRGTIAGFGEPVDFDRLRVGDTIFIQKIVGGGDAVKEFMGTHVITGVTSGNSADSTPRYSFTLSGPSGRPVFASFIRFSADTGLITFKEM